MTSKYSIYYLELALKDKKDQNIYAFQNISHIPTKKLIEIFEIDIDKDPNLIDGYSLKKKHYKKHKKYINKNIGQINLEIFEYCLRQYGVENLKEIRKLYKEDFME